MASASPELDFDLLLRKAIELEATMEGEDIEGFSLEPLDVNSLPLPPLAPPSTASPSPPLARGPAQTATPGAPFAGPTLSRRAREAQHRKQKGNARRSMRRQLERSAAPYGEYVVKPRTISKHVHPSEPIATKLQTKKLGHTKNAYTGARYAAGGHKRVYDLKDLVGSGSLGFKLIKWDGK